MKLTNELLMTCMISGKWSKEGNKKWNYLSSIAAIEAYRPVLSFLNESRTWIFPSLILMTRRIQWYLPTFLYTIMHNLTWGEHKTVTLTCSCKPKKWSFCHGISWNNLAKYPVCPCYTRHYLGFLHEVYLGQWTHIQSFPPFSIWASSFCKT